MGRSRRPVVRDLPLRQRKRRPHETRQGPDSPAHLQAVDLQRAIGLIERIKTLHDNDRWEASREHYQTLRAMLSDVIARCPENVSVVREKLCHCREQSLGDMENLVRRRVSGSISDRERSRLNQSLNGIQSDLEELASNVGFGDSLGDAR